MRVLVAELPQKACICGEEWSYHGDMNAQPTCWQSYDRDGNNKTEKTILREVHILYDDINVCLIESELDKVLYVLRSHLHYQWYYSIIFDKYINLRWSKYKEYSNKCMRPEWKNTERKSCLYAKSVRPKKSENASKCKGISTPRNGAIWWRKWCGMYIFIKMI